MPLHKPISFLEPSISSEIKKGIKDYITNHPTISSAGKAVLVIAALGGVLTIASITPGVFGPLEKFRSSHQRSKRERYKRLWQGFYRLKKERLLEFKEEKNGQFIYKITKKGEAKLQSFMLETLAVKKPNKWDGKWRIVIFDIPERRRNARKALQKKLLELGFYMMQKSVWVHPFPCEREIEFLKDFFNVKANVDILLISEMPNGRVIYNFRKELKKLI